jgi:outer membrane protein OmpA-like peptidoglycan-associated protein
MGIKFMNNQNISNKRTWKHVGASLMVLAMLGGCSSVPDAVNPVEWYRGTVELFSGDETDEATAAPTEGEEAVPGENEDFPELSSVPERPSVEEGGEVADGLIADPNKPAYATAITLQSDDDGTVMAAADSSDLQPPPPAQPTIAVEAQVVDLPPTEPTMPSTTNAATNVTSTVVATAPATMASAPLVVEPGRLPSGETYEEYRTRLMSGLNQTGTSSATTILISQPSSGGGLSSANTVIISSLGVQNAGQFGGGVTTVDSNVITSESGFLQIDSAGGQPLLNANSVKVATIHFSNGSSGLDVTDQRVLQKVAALLQEQGGLIRVIGHASSRTRAMDPVRHKMVNYNVSVSRADRIARELVRLGAAKNQIMIGAVSDTQPLYFEVMPSGEAGNRRAEIYIDS